MQFLSDLSPEGLRILGCFCIDALVFFQALDMRLGAELRRGRENAVFLQH